MSQDANFDGARSDGAAWPDESPAAQAPRPFFTFWRCCGCLAFVGIGLFLATMIGAKWVRDRAFELAPLEVPEIQVPPEEADEIAARFERALAAGEVVRITPEELTIVLQRAISQAQELGPQTRFHASATPEKLLDLRLRLHLPEEGDFPWFMRGRFINIAMVGTMAIEEGEIIDAKLASYRFSALFRGDNISEAESKKVLEELRQQSEVDRELRATVDRVKLFRFDGERIELQLVPE